MAIYRNVHLSFWDDAKVVDDFTPEDRYFMLYILTNPHTNLCGCYEISMKKMETELGYTRDSIENLINRFKNFHKVIDYDYDTKEILVKNWHKYNWTSSSKLDKPLRSEIENIKSIEFKRYLADLYNQRNSVEDTVSIPYQYGSDTTDSVTVTDTVPDTVSDSVTVSETVSETDTVKKEPKTKNSNVDRTRNSKKILENIIPEYCISEPLVEKLNEWIIYKTERRESYKEQGLKALLRRVENEEQKHGAIAIINLIDECMANGWKGIIWDKLNNTKNNNYRQKNDMDEWRELYEQAGNN